MRIACSASLYALLTVSFAACAGEKAPAATAQATARAANAKATTVAAHTEQGHTRLTWADARGTAHSIAVARDSTVAALAEPSGATVAGEIADSVLVIVDTYPSIPGGMSYCQSGTERFLRVLSIAAARPVETYRVKLASCLGNIELAADTIAWDAATSQLHINWLAGRGAAHGPESKTMRIGGDGRVQE